MVTGNSVRGNCSACGGWIDVGSEFSTWQARLDAFTKLHQHPVGAPQVYRWPGSDTERDAFTSALAALGYTSLGYAPLGGRMLSVHARRGAGDPVRLVAVFPGDLVGP